MTRETHIERYPKDNADDHDDDWVEFKVVDKIVLQGGRGQSYQKKEVKFLGKPSDRSEDSKTEFETKTMKVPRTKSQISEGDPNDPFGDSAEIENVKVMKKVLVKGGYGQSHTARYVTFENQDQSEREVRLRDVKVRTEGEKPGQDDEEQLTVPVEDVLEFEVKNAQGQSFERTKVDLDMTQLDDDIAADDDEQDQQG